MILKEHSFTPEYCSPIKHSTSLSLWNTQRPTSQKKQQKPEVTASNVPPITPSSKVPTITSKSHCSQPLPGSAASEGSVPRISRQMQLAMMTLGGGSRVFSEVHQWNSKCRSPRERSRSSSQARVLSSLFLN